MSEKKEITGDVGKQRYCEKAVMLEEAGRAMYLTLGEMLYNIQRDNLYQPFWDSWQEYCMEFKDLNGSSISKLITIYEIFVIKYGFTIEELAKAGGWTKLYQLAIASPTKAKAKAWLAKAETYSRRDLEKFIVEAKTGIDMTTCKHKDAYLIRVCPDCGDRHRVYEE
jgi:hypothetical protein